VGRAAILQVAKSSVPRPMATPSWSIAWLLQ
jgi:hypothetical protein